VEAEELAPLDAVEEWPDEPRLEVDAVEDVAPAKAPPVLEVIALDERVPPVPPDVGEEPMAVARTPLAATAAVDVALDERAPEPAEALKHPAENR
jgi:hypothetical protein